MGARLTDRVAIVTGASRGIGRGIARHLAAEQGARVAAYITGQIVYVDGGMLAQLRSPQVDTPLPATVQARLRR